METGKIRIYRIKTLKVKKIAQDNHSQTALVITDHNTSTQTIFGYYHQIDEIHKTIHQRGTADQIVQKISLETITLDQTQIEVNTQTIRETVQIQIPRTDNIPMTIPETLQIILLNLFKETKPKLFNYKTTKQFLTTHHIITIIKKTT